jgi:hypothetical protein
MVKMRGAFFADLLSMHHFLLRETFSEDMLEDRKDQFCQLTMAYSQEAELEEIFDSCPESISSPSMIVSHYCTVLREG